MSTNFDLNTIYEQLEGIDADMLSLKKKKAELEYAVEKYFEADINSKLAQKPDNCGTVTINMGDFDVKYNVAKRAKWDQEKLAELHEKIAQHEDPKTYIKVKYDVSESAFKAWPKDIQDAFMPARTLEHAGGKLTIVKK